MDQPSTLRPARTSSSQDHKEHPGYTLITGASQGIGRAMAEECARRGMPLLLVALDNPHLYQAADQLREEYGVAVRCLGIDLTGPNAPGEVWQWCHENGFQVVNLINNAGFGRSGLFEHLPQDEYHNMIMLNTQVLVTLTHHFLPSLKKLRRAHIMNMSSIEFAMPIPYKAVYTGTKNFVYAFSLSLREELKGSGVKVSVLCPGPVLTNPDGLKRIKAMGSRSRLLLMMPEDVAPVAIRGMLDGKSVIVPGRVPAFLALLARFLPRDTKMSLLERVFRKYKHEGSSVKA